MEQPITFMLEVVSDTDKSTIDEIARQLLGELKDTNIDSISFLQDTAIQKGAKTADPVLVGALMIAVLPTVLPELLGFLRDWAGRANNRTVKIKRQQGNESIEVEYDMKNISEDEIKHLLKVFGGVLKKK